MNAHYFQHVPFEGLGSIERWLHDSGFHISRTPFFDTYTLPKIEDVDFLIILGGPMSVNDVDLFAWLEPEIAFIKSVIDAGKPVLGICLGAQLISSALGSSVFANPLKEIGWFPVSAVPCVDKTMFRFPDRTEVFHWHGETFDLPVGSVRLAASAACSNQAFQIRNNVIGLQFHLETTAESVGAMIEYGKDELTPSAYVQSASEIQRAKPSRYTENNALMALILEYLLRNSGESKR